MFNDLIALLMAMPVLLAAKWGVWFAVGLGLSIWGRREKNYAHAAHDYDAPVAKPKSGVRSQRQPKAEPAAAATSDDPFADLEKLFAETPEGTHRLPGEAPSVAPVMAEEKVASPVLAESPRLAAPQSLP